MKSSERVHFWAEDPRVRGIVDNVADGIIAIDARGYIEFFNSAAERLFGYSAGEVMGRNVRMLAPGEHGANHDRYLADYLRTHEPRIIGIGREVEGVRKDGSTFPMHLSVGEIEVEGFNGFIGVVHDLSARKAAEREVSEARAFLQAILDSMPSILVGVDTQARITHWNRAAAEAQRLTLDDALGCHFSVLFPQLSLGANELLDAIRERRALRRERLLVRRGQELRYADVLVFPLDHASGGAVIRIDDVTERVRIEEMMVQTEKIMSVGTMAAGMAHEINNPLGILSQGCQNLLRRVSPEIAENAASAAELGVTLEQIRDYLERRGFFRFIEGMQEATGRANRIVTDMLTYCRRSTSSFEPVRLDALIDAALRLASHDYDLKKSYDFRRIRIVRDSTLEFDEIRCDAMAIQQVLLNLLRNAAQALAEGFSGDAPEVVIRLRDEGPWVRIELSDNGPGMSADVARRLFEPFFTTKPVGMGTGLGLSVSYFIVTEQHRGTLEVVSEPGRGATFVLRLPRQGRPYGGGCSDRR